MKKHYIFIMLLFGAGELLGQVTYPGNGNAGFGGAVGNGSLTLSDNGTTVFATFTKGGGNFNDAMVIYLDTRPGGFTNTSTFTDRSDGLRTAISSTQFPSDRALITFPPGFGADYAIAFNASFGGIWELSGSGQHNFVSSVNLSPTGVTTSPTYTFDFDFAEASAAAGFNFVATYTSVGAFLSDEVIGTSNVSGNPQINGTITFTAFRQYVRQVTTSTPRNDVESPKGFLLEQNYPNPFNPSTVVGFRLSVAGDASLKVYDLLGREVAVLVNGVLPAGAHTATFDASNLPSGVYMYKLEAGGQSMTRRMTLVK